MFSAGRYLVVDDSREELQLLIDALHGVGAPCVGIHYTGKPLRRETFAGVRVLFSDLYLLPGNTNEKTQFGVIEAMLRTNVDPSTGGPYLLVLWTTHDEQVGKLRDYLEERLDPQFRPLGVLALDKEPFLKPGGADKLAEAVHEQVSSSPQIRALVSWEADVLSAAGATLAAVTDLIPAADRTIAGFSDQLDGVLSRLAVASSGAPNVAVDPRGAINGVLAPILADRVLNAPERPEVKDIWKNAITRQDNLPDLPELQMGKMNRMLHLAMPPAEPVASEDWGAVLEIPQAARADAPMQERFGLTYAEMLQSVFKLPDDAVANVTPIVVRSGAICDHAQGNPGPRPYLFGLIIPNSAISANKAKDIKKLKPVFASPVLTLSEQEGPMCIYVHARFQITLTTAPNGWQPRFRIREQLMMSLNAHVTEYQGRPGIISLPE